MFLRSVYRERGAIALAFTLLISAGLPLRKTALAVLERQLSSLELGGESRIVALVLYWFALPPLILLTAILAHRLLQPQRASWVRPLIFPGLDSERLREVAETLVAGEVAHPSFVYVAPQVSAIPGLKQKAKNRHYAALRRASGWGKSTTLLHLAHDLVREGYVAYELDVATLYGDSSTRQLDVIQQLQVELDLLRLRRSRAIRLRKPKVLLLVDDAQHLSVAKQAIGSFLEQQAAANFLVLWAETTELQDPSESDDSDDVDLLELCNLIVRDFAPRFNLKVERFSVDWAKEQIRGGQINDAWGLTYELFGGSSELGVHLNGLSDLERIVLFYLSVHTVFTEQLGIDATLLAQGVGSMAHSVEWMWVALSGNPITQTFESLSRRLANRQALLRMAKDSRGRTVVTSRHYRLAMEIIRHLRAHGEISTAQELAIEEVIVKFSGTPTGATALRAAFEGPDDRYELIIDELSTGRNLSPSTATEFSHRTEWQFARLLDFYQIEWEYEPRSFDIEWDRNGSPSQEFTPDFYLPQYDLYVEITTLNQKLVTRKNRKVRRLREIYPEVKCKVIYHRDYFNLFMKYGLEPRIWAERAPRGRGFR